MSARVSKTSEWVCVLLSRQWVACSEERGCCHCIQEEISPSTLSTYAYHC